MKTLAEFMAKMPYGLIDAVLSKPGKSLGRLRFGVSEAPGNRQCQHVDLGVCASCYDPLGRMAGRRRSNGGRR